MTHNIQLLPLGGITPHVCYLVLLMFLLPVGSVQAGDLFLALNAVDPTCHGAEDGSIRTDISGGNPPFLYRWSTGSKVKDLSGVGAGSYSVTVTDCDGRRSKATAVLRSPDPMQISLVYSPDRCSAPVEISALVEGGTPPYDYTWSDGSTDSVLFTSIPGDYSVTVTDSRGCSVEESTNYAGASDLEVAAAQIQYSCGDPSGSVTVVGLFGVPPYTFLWSNGDTSATATGLLPGQLHMVSVTDAVGCMVSRDFPLVDFDGLDFVLDKSLPACAEDGPAIVVVKPPGDAAAYDYSWSDGTNGQSAVFDQSGDYAVTIYDQQGCGGSKEFSIIVPDPLAVGISVEPDRCGSWDGEASAMVSGGTPPYHYDWGNEVNEPVVSGLPLGNYTLTVRDTNGCTVTDRFSIAGPSAELSCRIKVVQPASDPNTGDGVLQVFAEGGTPPYSYRWSDGQASATATGLSPGSYAVTLVDSLNCSSICEVEMTAELVGKATVTAPVNFKLYPNPFQRYLMVELPSLTDYGDTRLLLQTVHGKTLKVFESTEPLVSWMIPVADLPRGLYIARLQLGVKKEQVYRLIKN